MYMKIKSVFLLSSLTMALGLGVFAGVSGLNSDFKSVKATGFEFKVVDANNSLNGADLYIYTWQTGDVIEKGVWETGTILSKALDSNGRYVYSINMAQDQFGSYQEIEVFTAGHAIRSWEFNKYTALEENDDCYVITGINNDNKRNNAPTFDAWPTKYSSLRCGYRVFGSFDGWDTSATGGVAMVEADGSASATLDLAKGDKIKVGHAWYEESWNLTSYEAAGDPVSTGSSNGYTASKDGTDVMVNHGTTWTVSMNVNTHVYTLTPEVYTIHCGTQSATLVGDEWGGFNAKIILTAGEPLQIKKSSVAQEFTVNSAKENNLVSDGEGNYVPYLSTTWAVNVYVGDGLTNVYAGGYYALWEFAESFLSGTLDGGVCEPANWDTIKSDFSELDPFIKTEFKRNVDLVLAGGDRNTYTDDIYEAAVRYVVIVEKGYAPFDGVTISEAYINQPINSSYDYMSLIMIASSISVVVFAGISFLVLKKKKEI